MSTSYWPVYEKLSSATMGRPAYLMCPPFSHTVDHHNNIWMKEYQPGDGNIDYRRGLLQFLELYHFIASEALVYLLPTPAKCGLQDQVFTANLAFVPEHLPGRETVVVSNFSSEPRKGETGYGVKFFETMGYQTLVAPFRFEGEAELKHLYDNVYIGGYGERSDAKTYEWMAENFDMKIIQVEETDPYLYHLDCSIFPLSHEETLVCTEIFTPEEIKQIESVTDIIDVSADVAYSGICNSLRLDNIILNASNIHDLKAGTEDYQFEIAKNRVLEDICAERGFEIAYFNLSEYMKSGALLSCMIMHLNRHSYSIRTV
ncbi:MAG: arginine deiminase-related protein [Methylococcaceae bacterium]|nr:arginine deiminase-related protein [Methylococcaceae bacterium]